jgi:hypothetical protein
LSDDDRTGWYRKQQQGTSGQKRKFDVVIQTEALTRRAYMGSGGSGLHDSVEDLPSQRLV